MAAPTIISRTVHDGLTLGKNIGFTEGPVWTTDGRLFVTSVSRGALYEIFLDGRPAVAVAETGGGPNGMTLGCDGRLWITQNGGGAMPTRSQLPVSPSIQVWDHRAAAAPSTIFNGRVHAPSDCTFGPDGALWFTDPNGHGFGSAALPGRVWRYDPAADHASVVLDDVFFPNGIAFGPDPEHLYVAETARNRVRRYVVTAHSATVDHDFPQITVSTPDGITIDAQGGLWVAGSKSGKVTYFDSTGQMCEQLAIGVGAMPTSVCFAGDALDRLIVTVAKGGRVLAFPVETSGLPTPPASPAPPDSSPAHREELQ
ncbi:SMP-30/gluconolactonase/LRE family protein [Rhodococcus sp. 14C212]|uniref:SMP-30/gluconolactonase/LRE family protein n=1 Tax=Rhodococcus sp. 14C212 TaxID=2711209 RepID=UPI0013EE2810|nr:SMP-30/gluconolactonase/LRE family protein [Rhodococcus sp. 14C212]NGP08034.1 SMP-30/gluconolactonase/LRE family protein [Rhodococcus sp. 14C212]